MKSVGTLLLSDESVNKSSLIKKETKEMKKTLLTSLLCTAALTLHAADPDKANANKDKYYSIDIQIYMFQVKQFNT